MRRQKTTVLGAIKKIKNGYIGGARYLNYYYIFKIFLTFLFFRVVMKNISDFFRTTSISNFDLQVSSIENLFKHERRSLPRSLKTIRPSFDDSS